MIALALAATGLAYLIGEQFKDNHTVAFILAFAAALSLTISIEIVRHVRTKRKKRTMARESTSA